MLITRETDYALRILRALSAGRFEKAAVLSEQELIPPQFIYKILKKLAHAKLVEVRAGNRGGCCMIADPTKVTLLDVIRAMGDRLLVNACNAPNYRCNWEDVHHAHCQYHFALETLQHKIEQELRQTTLATLFAREQVETIAAQPQ